MKKVSRDHWTLNKMFTFTEIAFLQLNWTGSVKPRLSYAEMLVGVSVRGDDVLFMINQIRVKCSK